MPASLGRDGIVDWMSIIMNRCIQFNSSPSDFESHSISRGWLRIGLDGAKIAVQKLPYWGNRCRKKC